VANVSFKFIHDIVEFLAPVYHGLVDERRMVIIAVFDIRFPQPGHALSTGTVGQKL
jgi:hypothetical protein